MHAPVEVLAREPQYRLAFSQSTTPPQLSVNVLPVMAKCSHRSGNPAVGAGLGNVDRRYQGTHLSSARTTTALRTKVLLSEPQL